MRQQVDRSVEALGILCSRLRKDDILAGSCCQCRFFLGRVCPIPGSLTRRVPAVWRVPVFRLPGLHQGPYQSGVLDRFAGQDPQVAFGLFRVDISGQTSQGGIGLQGIDNW